MTGETPTRVLLVDDDEPTLMVLEALLSSKYDVVTAKNGEDALTLFSPDRFDVLCTDYLMPGMTGVELIDKVAQSGAVFGPVLVTGLQAYVDGDRKQSESGVKFRVLIKPCSPDRLMAAIDQAAALVRMRRAVTEASEHASTLPASS